MFEKSLQDLVKGIRSHKRDPSAFISQSIQEIKLELRNVDPFVKAQVRRNEGERRGKREEGKKDIPLSHLHSPPRPTTFLNSYRRSVSLLIFK